MTHEKKIKALIENIGYLNAEDLAGVVYEAHDSIKLLAEIADAAGECRVQGGAREPLNALLAKYTEASNE